MLPLLLTVSTPPLVAPNIVTVPVVLRLKVAAVLSVVLEPAYCLVAVADAVHTSAEYAARTKRVCHVQAGIARCAIEIQAAAVRCAKNDAAADITAVVLEGQQSVVKGERLPACNVEVRAAEETDRATAAATAIRIKNYPVQRVCTGKLACAADTGSAIVQRAVAEAEIAHGDGVAHVHKSAVYQG